MEKYLEISSPTGNLYIVTDSHLDYQSAPYLEFIQWLQQLNSPQVIICLGDLFKIWLGFPKFWSTLHCEVMSAFQNLTEQGVYTVFVAGNREVLLPKQYPIHHQPQFPFTHLTLDSFSLQWGKKRYGFIHGDTLNPDDHAYLRWKAFVNHRATYAFFHLLPPFLARNIAEKLEQSLHATNQEYKLHFPHTHLQKYTNSVLSEYDEYFIGHFHTDREMHSQEQEGTLHVVSDWLAKRAYLQISPEGHIEKQEYQGA